MRTQSLAFVLVAVVAGCSSAPTRTVTGQLTATSSNSVVTARSANHQEFTSSVAATGRFTLALPTGASYELAFGSARIDWPTASGPARWAKLGSGATLDLGHVSKQHDGHFACDHHAGDDDHCDRDDDRDGGDDGEGHDDGDGHDTGDGHDCDGGTHGGGGAGGGGGGGAGGGGGGGPGGIN